MTVPQNDIVPDEARAWVGRSQIAEPYLVTKLDIAKFAFATGNEDPVHLSEAAARAAGHPTIVAPLSFYLVIRLGTPNLVPRSQLNTDGTAHGGPPMNADRVMAGATSVRFNEPIHAGDIITLRTTYRNIYEKAGRSGPLGFMELDFAYQRDGSTVVDETYTRIFARSQRNLT